MENNINLSMGYLLVCEKCIYFGYCEDEFWLICYCWFNEYICLLMINY